MASIADKNKRLTWYVDERVLPAPITDLAWLKIYPQKYALIWVSKYHEDLAFLDFVFACLVIINHDLKNPWK